MIRIAPFLFLDPRDIEESFHARLGAGRPERQQGLNRR